MSERAKSGLLIVLTIVVWALLWIIVAITTEPRQTPEGSKALEDAARDLIERNRAQ